MRQVTRLLAAGLLLAGLSVPAAAATPERGQVTGEVIDTWCYISEIMFAEGTTNVANPAILEIQTHRVSVEGDLYERDGIKYLLIDQVVNDEGIVTINQDDFGIQPFGE